jgi:hypothetical protein
VGWRFLLCRAPDFSRLEEVASAEQFSFRGEEFSSRAEQFVFPVAVFRFLEKQASLLARAFCSQAKQFSFPEQRHFSPAERCEVVVEPFLFPVLRVVWLAVMELDRLVVHQSRCEWLREESAFVAPLREQALE